MRKIKPAKRSVLLWISVILFPWILWQCTPPLQLRQPRTDQMPLFYADTLRDTLNPAILSYTLFYQDSLLISLINQGLKNNQELNSFQQEVEVAKWEAFAKRGDYLPFLRPFLRTEGERSGRYTWTGTVESQLEIAPEMQSYYAGGALFSWELDVWKLLRNRRKSAYFQYLSTQYLKHYLTTQIVAEIASSYYELMALQSQIQILNDYISLQKKTLSLIQTQKQAARVTELAVKRFEAEIAKNEAKKYALQQKIVEVQNHLYFLLGQYPTPLTLPSNNFLEITFSPIHAGIPIQLLQNRPDIQAAEYELKAANVNIHVARAAFYPRFSLDGTIGLEAFHPDYLLDPASLFYRWGFFLLSPLVNRIELKANYFIAGAKQQQAVLHYEQKVLQAYLEVLTSLAKIQNMEQAFLIQQKQVSALQKAVQIADNLFIYAETDYLEVLTAQRDALEAQMELVETKKQYLNAFIELYRSLGGGWQE